ncbi:MAG: RNA pyrophosphohydrolase [Alphaproteobacteria bacterium]
MSPEEQKYRLGVGLVIVNKEKKVFIGQRVDAPLDNQGNFIKEISWQMPQGGIDGNEAPGTTALREMYEEVGIKNARIISQTKDWHSYDFPPHIHNEFFFKHYKGQRQKWFLIEFLGGDKDISLINNNVKYQEFSHWR